MNDRLPGSLRPRPRSTIAVAMAIASMLLVGCSSDDSASAPVASGTPATSDAPTSTALEAPAASPLEGTWQAGPVSLADTEATVRRAGLGRWLDDYRHHAPFIRDTVLTLTIEDGAWDLFGQARGGQAEPIDFDAEYEVQADTVVFHHSDGSNTYRWEIDGDTLHLQFLESTLPGYRGVPEEVFQRALYTTQAFTKLN